MFSNTAIPRYYGEFRRKVLAREIVVCNNIAMQMARIDELIRNPAFYYDSDAVEGWIQFAEEEMTLTDGDDIVLLDSFKLWAEDVYGWYYFIERSIPEPIPGGGTRYVNKRIKKRLINKQYLIVGRGAAKSLYMTLHQAYRLTVDTSTTHQITTAPTMKLSEEVMSTFRTAITRSKGPFFKFLTEGSLQNTTGSRAKRQKLCSTKVGIQNFLTGSYLEIRPMTIDKLQGLRCVLATVDEWLSGDTREDVFGAIEQGASKNDDYLIIGASSEGTVRNGAGDDIKMELMKILRGEYYNPHVSIWYYQLDDVKEVSNPAMWIKANPNIGITVTYEVYQLDVEKAEHNPSARNDILAKRFGIPLEGYTYFFTYAETLKHEPVRNYWNMPCALGADMSMGDDFCAFTFMFPLPYEEFGIKARSYITQHTLNQLPPAMFEKYEQFIREGSLIIMDGINLDMMLVYDDLEQYILDNGYDVRAFGYDPYNADAFVKRWCMENSAYGVLKVPQGKRTESVPLGELKKYSERRLLRFDQEIMQFTMGNCVTAVDTNGNRKLLKERRDKKIDNVAAMMDAYIAFKEYKELFE